MSGSTMFVMYQDGSGNITLSTRKGHGHDMPEYSTFQGVKLLEGTGVSNKTMVANVQCSGFTHMDFSGSNDWIGAWKKGQALDDTSVRATIEEHDGTDRFSVDFAKASITSDGNPFTKTTSNTPSSTSGNDAVSGGGGGEDHTGTIHGIIMSIVFLIGFPVGSLLMPLIGQWLIHAGWQITVFVGMWVGFGIGKIAADKNGQVRTFQASLSCFKS
jgi:flagellin-like hook-associated protein FlgL